MFVNFISLSKGSALSFIDLWCVFSLHLFISVMIFISFLILTLGSVSSSFPTSFRCKFRLLTWVLNCWIAIKFPLNTAFVKFSCTSKVMLKILQARLQKYVNWELPDVLAGFRKGRRTNCQHPLDHRKKQKSSRTKHLLLLLTMPKALTVWTTTNCGKLFKRWEYQTTLPASWKICMQVKKQQLEPDMEQLTGSKSR